MLLSSTFSVYTENVSPLGHEFHLPDTAFFIFPSA